MLNVERSVIGFYCLVFGLYWRIQLKRTDRWKGVLLYPLTASFILCTAYFIIDIIQVQFLITVSHCSDVMAFPPSNMMSGVQLISLNSQINVLGDVSLYSAYSWMVIANNALYTAIDFISQLILVSVLQLSYILYRLMSFFPPLLLNEKLYRCWIMWHQPLVMVIPSILSIAFLGAHLPKKILNVSQTSY